MKQRSFLGEHRVDYTFTCGVCGKEIRGKCNTVHLGIGSHIKAEYAKGLRKFPYSIPADKSRKFT